MKLHISQQVFEQFDDESRAACKSTACSCCVADLSSGNPDPDCEACDGTGVIYEFELSAEDSAAIQENLRSQGVPLGKTGAH